MPVESEGHYKGERRRAADHGFFGRVHFDPRINIGHIFTTLSVLVAVLLWGTTVENRFIAVDKEVAFARLERARADVERNVTRSEIRDELRDIRTEIRALNVKLSEKKAL